MNISKIDNLPPVVDLFCGCGGMAAGFQKAGFTVGTGMDINDDAVQTASYNLHWRYGEETTCFCGDITELSPDSLPEATLHGDCIVTGGPPCQAYSLAGRAKLKSLGPERENINDSRGYLYQDFLRFATGLNAKAIVMENVPESTNYGGKNIPEIVCETLENHGYHALWTILNAADFGVPQKRERVFVIAVRTDVADQIVLPQPVRRCPSPEGPVTAGRIRSFSKFRHFHEPVRPDDSLPDWVTVEEAICDLPVLFTSPTQKYSVGRIAQKDPYRSEPLNSFQEAMRSWYGRETKKVSGNVFRKTVRDFPIFERMQQGDNFQQASEIADLLLQEKADRAGITEAKDPEEFARLRKETVPPYDRNNFLYKWTKLQNSQPSHTLVAHLSVDTYSHIHPEEPRGISVREAARLQSFPDEYLFQGNMGVSFKQIGNAVPPLLSFAIAKALKETLMQNGSDRSGNEEQGENNGNRN